MQNIHEQKAVLEQLVADLLTEARSQGTSAAEAAVSQSTGLSVNVRMGQVETIEHTRDRGLGVTVYFGNHKGSASTTDLTADAVRDTVAAACKIARYTQDDPYSGLADAALMATNPPDLDLYHPWDLSPDHAIELAIACEDAARAVDTRITNSEGATLNSHDGLYVYGNSHGFIGGYPSSSHSLSCAVLAQEGDSMQRDHWWNSARSATELESPITIGKIAAERALARLGARPLTTRTAPIVFQSEVAVGLLRSLIGAIRGSALYRKASFLLDHQGRQIFPEFVRIYESPHLLRGMGSAPFDQEGVATQARDVVANGILQGYVLDSYSARKLGMQTTGNAGGVHNLTIAPGDLDRIELRKTLGTGLWVTELLGQGVSTITGDYSRGAAGFWIENGEIAYPVEEITIASNLKEMFLGLQAVGCDVDRRGSVSTGSWLLSPMTIAGS